MPFVDVKAIGPITKDQKKELVAQITSTLVTVLGKSSSHVHIVIDEVSEENWGFEGLLAEDWKAQNSD